MVMEKFRKLLKLKIHQYSRSLKDGQNRKPESRGGPKGPPSKMWPGGPPKKLKDKCVIDILSFI